MVLINAGNDANGEPVIISAALYTEITEDANGNPVAMTTGEGITKDGYKIDTDGITELLLRGEIPL